MATPENPNINQNEQRETDPSTNGTDDMAAFLYTFNWLKDENLLRDEGSYYGLTTDDPSEKVKTIENFYEEFIAQVERAIQLHEEALSKIEEQQAAIRSEIEAKSEKLEYFATTYFLEPNAFWRVLTGLIGYSILIVFNFWLVFELTTSPWSYPMLIALGIYAFGLFSAFQRKNWIYDEDDKRSWKVYVEEIGIPAVATFFIIAGAEKINDPLMLAGAAAVLFLLFVFSGKGFFSSIQTISPEYKIRMENQLKNRHRKNAKRKLQLAISKLENQLSKLDEQSISISNKKFDKWLELEKLNKKKNTVVAYFQSEFKLAQESKKYLAMEEMLNKGK